MLSLKSRAISGGASSKFGRRYALLVSTALMASTYAQPAYAACVVDGTATTCSDPDNTVVDVNAAINSIAGPNQNTIIAAGATVIGGGNISPTHQGAIGFTNNGLLGVEATPVGLNYSGDSASAANSFAFTNNALGVVEGRVDIFNVGGPITFVNNGAINDATFIQSEESVEATLSGASTDVQIETGAGSTFTATPPTVVLAGTVTTTTTKSTTVLAAGASNTTVTTEGEVADLTVLDASGGNHVLVVDGAVGTDLAPAGVTVETGIGGNSSSSTLVGVIDSALPAGNLAETYSETQSVPGGSIELAV